MKDVAINVETQISLLDPDFSPLGTYLRVRLLDHTLILFLFEETSYCFSGEGNGTPLQHSCLENPMDGGAWWAAVHGVAKSRTQLSDFTFTFRFPALEKEMATHSSVLAWRIPGTGEPGGLPSLGSHSRKRLSSSSSRTIFHSCCSLFSC